MRKDIVCFYIISYITHYYITTVYRIYGAHRKAIVVLVAIRIEQIVGTSISNAVVRIH